MRAVEQKKTERGPCRVAHVCGGCSGLHLAYELSWQLKLELARARLRDAGFGDALLRPQPARAALGYRNALKWVFAPCRRRGLKLGLYRRGTHAVVDTSNCVVQHPSLLSWAKDFRKIARNLPLWDPLDPDRQGLQYAVARVEPSGRRIQVLLVSRGRDLAREVAQCLRRLPQDDYEVVSAYAGLHPAGHETNRVMPPQLQFLFGDPEPMFTWLGTEWSQHPAGFFQLNYAVSAQIYRDLEARLPHAGANPRAWDLYAGQSTLGRIFRRLGYDVEGAEDNPYSVAAAQRCFPEAPIACASVADWLNTARQDPALIAVNPPRRGLSPEVRTRLCPYLEAGSLLVYVSCELTSLLRDLGELFKQPPTLLDLAAYDMFPHTDKLEWLVVARNGGMPADRDRDQRATG